jgi:hypothetical protein
MGFLNRAASHHGQYRQQTQTLAVGIGGAGLPGQIIG